MTATLRVVLDQLTTPTDANLAMAESELARALVETAPRGCVVSAIVPANHADEAERLIPGLKDVAQSTLARRELTAAWQLGVAPRLGGGLIHAASLAAPLVKHDRVHNHDQTVVTLWDLTPWLGGEGMSKPALMWHRAMLKRAERHADAVIVPTHTMAEQLRELSRLGSRVRVISGAAPEGFAVPTDAVGRRRTLELPEEHILVAPGSPAELRTAFAAVVDAGIELPVVVLDQAEGREPAVVDIAVSAGLVASRVHVRSMLDVADRAAALASARAMVAPSSASAFPWRVLEALRLGVPVVAAASEVHKEVLFDGGLVAEDENAFGESLAQVMGSDASHRRFAVMAADRGRGFSWRVAAESVWALHAEL
ncbi:glycosyltransferase involved in cell wall biosynthesis [Microbacterium endophyticum]|uniref:Glycosyltransferase involved in cell wall biosynthesis n=1 Tax=Microbacterium endophyticum TaxID=1526412 RepID=A0A7W4V3U7_9MICO|nr:glycosyltransferase [Microbacterium endophyticum]MBB2976356.1 glycosyltransferase involved in cell wall biosynthesis [Microbacterium endophyticum]NIK35237.1 glycosyltransferase involved in cell wall biosynthesis [Microbacterium endophyticum]